jgi:cell division protein FtsQ
VALGATHRPGLGALSTRQAALPPVVWLRLLAALVGIALLAELAFVVLASPRLAVRAVVVRGDREIAALVAPRIRLPANTNIVRVPLEMVRRQAESVPAVRRARVGRDLPFDIVVRVERREPMAVVRSAERAVLVDPEGIPFIVPEEWGWGLPELVSPRLAGADFEAEGAADDIAAMLKVMRALGPDPRLRATRVQVMRDGDIEVTLECGAVVNLGRAAQLGAKARCLAAALQQLGRDRIARLDVADPKAAFWRPRPEGALDQ